MKCLECDNALKTEWLEVQDQDQLCEPCYEAFYNQKKATA